MNKILKSLALGVCLIAQAEVPDKKLDVKPGETLEVNLKTGGSIHIRGVAENAVTVKARSKGRNEDQNAVTVDRSAKGVRIVSEHGKGVDLEITVPTRFDADLKTMGGEIQIDGVDGNMHGSTMGGALNLSNLKGRVDLSTMGGNVTLVSSYVDGKLHTMGGSVKIKDVVGDIKGSSMGGNVVYDNVLRPGGGANAKEVEISTMGGEINVASAPSGANVKTMGGGIHIGSAKDFVKAKTMGGEIEIKELDGSVDASTMGGDITVNMTGEPASGKHDVKLDSKSGEIRLTLPANFSADIDVELNYTKNSSRNYKIDSGFPLSISETPEWDEGHGTPRKTIKGTASVNGGKNKIVIRTINGNVILKKW
jgi:hypothetical protein